MKITVIFWSHLSYYECAFKTQLRQMLWMFFKCTRITRCKGLRKYLLITSKFILHYSRVNSSFSNENKYLSFLFVLQFLFKAFFFNNFFLIFLISFPSNIYLLLVFVFVFYLYFFWFLDFLIFFIEIVIRPTCIYSSSFFIFFNFF